MNAHFLTSLFASGRMMFFESFGDVLTETLS